MYANPQHTGISVSSHMHINLLSKWQVESGEWSCMLCIVRAVRNVLHTTQPRFLIFKSDWHLAQLQAHNGAGWRLQQARTGMHVLAVPSVLHHARRERTLQLQLPKRHMQC